MVDISEIKTEVSHEMYKEVIMTEKELEELVGWTPYAMGEEYGDINPEDSYVQLVCYEDEGYRLIKVYNIYGETIGEYTPDEYPREYRILRKCFKRAVIKER